MAKEKYRHWGARGPYAQTRKLIIRCDEILNHYYADGDGFPLTLRQLFYKLVAENTLPNTPKQYERLSNLMRDARYWGLIDWDMLIDRTRTMWDWTYHDDERAALKHAETAFKMDAWAEQKTRIEIWIEKDAAIGVIEKVCRDLRVPYGSTRGYHSTSGAKQGSSRIFRFLASDQRLLALHLADHDPSGWDMTRDLTDRLKEIVGIDLGRAMQQAGHFEDDAAAAHGEGQLWFEDAVEIRRIALMFDQAQELDLPSQPVKPKDSRTPAYREKFGISHGWELDALEPSYLEELIRDAVLDVRDDAAWESTIEAETLAKRNLGLAHLSWNAPGRIRAVEEAS